jgi:uncharacterized protein (DUF1330 family)
MTCEVIDPEWLGAEADTMTSYNTDTSSLDGAPRGFWGSYAMAVLDDLRFGPAIVEYLERIEETLRPYGGAFLVHGAPWQQVEGDPIGAPVLIAFPRPDGAQQWYWSAAYQQLAPLRTDNSVSRVFLIQGVDAAHRSTDIIELLADRGR